MRLPLLPMLPLMAHRSLEARDTADGRPDSAAQTMTLVKMRAGSRSARDPRDWLKHGNPAAAAAYNPSCTGSAGGGR